MATAANSKTRLGVAKENSLGNAPVPVEFVTQRHSTESLALTINEILDDSKSSTRQYDYSMQGLRSVGGSIDGNLDHTNFSAFLESALFSAWDNNTLKLGDSMQSLRIEKSTSNGAYFLYKGMVANNFTLTSTNGDDPVTVSFDFMGLEQEQSTVSESQSPYEAPVDVLPYTACGGLISEGGLPLAMVQSVSLTVNNGVTSEYYWGNCDVGDLVPGRVEVTGTLEVFFGDLSLYNKFVEGAQSTLSFTLTNGTAGGNKTMTFSLPRIKYTGGEIPSGTGADSLVLTLNFRGLYDPSDETGLVITRSA